MTTFGALLRRLRVGAGLSQSRLARLAAIDPAYVNRLERSAAPDHPPRRAIILRLWSALEAPLEDRERLLVAAGHCPEAILLAGGWDPFVRTIRGQATAGLAVALDHLGETLTVP